MPFTDLPAVKATLVAALQGRPALAAAIAADKLFVARGLPAALPEERQRMYAGRVDEAVRTPHDPARSVRRERAEILVIVEAHADELDPAVAEGQVWALIEELDALLTDTPHLVGDGWEAYLGRVSEEDTGPVGDGWLARATARVVLEATRV